MTPAKLNIMIARFPYAGTGATQSENPDVADWLVETVCKMKADPRVGEISRFRRSDTPIPMVRNAAVHEARQARADLLLMVDSDMAPDVELLAGDATAKPFWESSFDFLFERKMKGLVTVVGAPYCGPPPCENVYVFRWADWQSHHPADVPDWRQEAFSREEAAGLGGFGEVSALPTGLILFDMAAFDLIEHPYFYYEFAGDGRECQACGCRKPGPQRQKDSTEDVTSTRDMALILHEKLGYNPLFCAWDSWAGHWKPKCVRKPRPVGLDDIGQNYRRAVLAGRRADTQNREVRPGKALAALLEGRRGNGQVPEVRGNGAAPHDQPGGPGDGGEAAGRPEGGAGVPAPTD